MTILEIKNTKDDVTITEKGRLVHSGDECYDKNEEIDGATYSQKMMELTTSAQNGDEDDE